MKSLILTLISFSVMLTGLTSCTNDTNLINDPNLLRAINDALAIPMEEDITIDNLESLEELYAQNLHISSIGGLEHCKNLKRLSLLGNNISNVEPLENLNNLELLYLENNDIESIEAIGNLRNLYFLSIGYNPIRNIDVLEFLPSLNYVGLSNTEIISLEPLINNVNFGTQDELYLGSLEKFNEQIRNTQIPLLEMKGVIIQTVD